MLAQLKQIFGENRCEMAEIHNLKRLSARLKD
jgi:hypothetical protein